MFFEEWFNNEDMVHNYSEILFSHKKRRNTAIVTMLMDVKSMMLSEMSQMEK